MAKTDTQKVKENKDVYSVLSSIQDELKVAKDKYNSFGNFNYYNVSDVFTALKPLLKKYNAVLYWGDTEILLVGNRYYVVETAILRVEGEEIRVQARAQEAEKPKAKMDEGQLSGSTSSYAQKYALNKMFLINDGKDLDSQTKDDYEQLQTELSPTEAFQKEQERKNQIRDILINKIRPYVPDELIKDWKAMSADEAIAKMTEYHSSLETTN